MYEEKIQEMREITDGNLSEIAAKKLIMEMEYLRPGNTGTKWPGIYGPYRFWFSSDKHRKIHLHWDSTATAEAINIWKQLAQELYGSRFVNS